MCASFPANSRSPRSACSDFRIVRHTDAVVIRLGWPFLIWMSPQFFTRFQVTRLLPARLLDHDSIFRTNFHLVFFCTNSRFPSQRSIKVPGDLHHFVEPKRNREATPHRVQSLLVST